MKRPTIPTLPPDQYAPITKEEALEVGRIIQHRRYQTPRGFVAPEKVTGSLAAFVKAAAESGVKDENAWRTVLATKRLMEHECPILWLTRDISEALHNTDFPEEMDLGEIVLPHPGFMIQVPQGVITAPNGFDVSGIVLAEYEKGDDVSLPEFGITHVAKARNTGFALLAWAGNPEFSIPRCPEESVKEVVWLLTLPRAGNIRDAFDNQMKGFLDQTYDVSTGELSKRRDAQSEAKAITEELMKFTTKAVLYLMSRDKEMPRPSVHRKEKVKRGKVLRDALWSPNIVGRYKTMSSSEFESEPAGTTRSPHWVRGHFRRVRYGKGRRLVKTKMIWPYKTGGGDGAS